MKTFMILVAVCGSLSMNAMNNDDKKINGGIIRSQRIGSVVESDGPPVLPHGFGLIQQWRERKAVNFKRPQPAFQEDQLKKSTGLLPVV